VLLVVSVAATAAGADARLHPGAPFDGRYAYELTKLQLSYGPRPAGSAAQQAAAAKLVRLLPGGHFEPVPGGLRNIVGQLPGRLPAILVVAHYDTTDVPGYLGANNSAAGVGAVIALAKALRSDPTRLGQSAVRFLLTDGEEAPSGFKDFYAEGLRGSKAYAAAHAKEFREVIVLDFIALHKLRLTRDVTSDVPLWARLRAAASRAGTGALFPPASQGAVMDDHTPFLRAGIPAVDLIDFSYACWQKLCDDLGQVSQTNLQRVGTTVLELIRTDRSPGYRRTASAHVAVGITQSSIAGIHLGASRAQARTSMTKPVRLDRLEDGYVRLVSPRQKLESYFRTGTKGAAVVTTWNRRLATGLGIGPCSTVAALKRAYGSRLAPFRQGAKIVAYRLGNLVFTVEGGKRVGVVALGRGPQAVYVALNATECS